MTEINWNSFKAKFNNRESWAFESLSYHLFCHEFELPLGIFRFKNQTGIETEPIKSENRVIGFQSKYYTTPLSKNKGDVLSSISKAKQKNPTITEIYLYVNQEFSESPLIDKKDPDYKVEIEREAAKINVTIVWKVPSHFEIQLVQPALSNVTDLYFSLGSTIFDLIEGLNKHTEHLLLSIQSQIVFGDDIIKINRSETVSLIKQLSEPDNVIILTGDGGCGKSGIVKDLYSELKEVPFYFFKAREFNVRSIGNILKTYGNFTFEQFLNVHSEHSQKIIVIDSAESLAEINENQETFKEFLAAILKENWKIIITTRQSYLDSLIFQFVGIYGVSYNTIPIENLSQDDLKNLSVQNSFTLPDNERVKKILCNLFYLKEFLNSYRQIDPNVYYSKFREILWQKKIQNSSYTARNTHVMREKSFMEIAKLRSNSGKFFVMPEQCNESIVSLLVKDEILSYDTINGGYFITHDVYEEWALELIITRAYKNTTNLSNFFQDIGTSLPMRRTFRKWLSLTLQESPGDIDDFMFSAIGDSETEHFWKDEIFIAILYSEVSELFFERLKSKLLEDNLNLLKRFVFLLRIACKEPDEVHNKLYEKDTFKYLFTKPSGNGWKSTIKIIFQNLSLFDEENNNFFIPLLLEWVQKNIEGNTTRMAGLIALELYKKNEFRNHYRHIDNEKELVNIILYSSAEIKNELEKIFSDIIQNKWVYPSQPYYELTEAILKSKFESIILLKTLPKHVIQLSNLFWCHEDDQDEPFHYRRKNDAEYGINERGHNDYFPPSAYQTPIYHLLRFDFYSTIDFIISFTDRAIRQYEKSAYGKQGEHILISIEDDVENKQYVSQNVFQIYRGSGSPVTPYLLQSIHMALEKRLLEIAKSEPPAVTISWLKHILKSSYSASLTAVVISVVLAYPDKFFNIALILFSAPRLFVYDRLRSFAEKEAYNLTAMGYGLNYATKYYEDERLETMSDEFRKTSLETLIISYQFFHSKTVSEQEALHREESIQSVLDKHNAKLCDIDTSSEESLYQRLLLTRIDKRKIKVEMRTEGESTFIDFNPLIEEDVEQHRQEALAATESFTRYLELKLWAENKFTNPSEVKYMRYENDPLLALAEMKDILANWSTVRENDDDDENMGKEDWGYLSSEATIPAFVSAAMVMHYHSLLAEDDLKLCAEILLENAGRLFSSDYDYQISDGTEVSIHSLAQLSQTFPETHAVSKIILLLTLFNDYNLGSKRICDYALDTINNEWFASHGDYTSDFIYGFLKFQPAYKEILQKNRRSGNPLNAYEEFEKLHQKELEYFANNRVSFSEDVMEQYSLNTLENLFSLIPTDTSNPELIILVSKIIPNILNRILTSDRDRDRDYHMQVRFFKRYGEYLIMRSSDDLQTHSKIISDYLIPTREGSQLLEGIISAAYVKKRYESFWAIWKNLNDAIVALSHTDRGNYFEEVLLSYMLASNISYSSIEDWPELDKDQKNFYQKLINDIANHQSMLYIVVKILLGKGKNYIDDGIIWMSNIVANNTLKINRRHEEDTIYYMENLLRKYIYSNRSKVKQDVKLKNRILTLLTFLIERTSVTAYLLREDII
ncbi:AVAST type 4 anti-phage nuclease Avs4 [Flavobacterium sp. RHBU_3]|uniref:AVAST type 4 anti-phage nuclease Avs4 n=1 Tax=Flavobacterium sp. RHBU_3 TaxID=3391184 RepID=UPI003984B6F4